MLNLFLCHPGYVFAFLKHATLRGVAFLHGHLDTLKMNFSPTEEK